VLTEECLADGTRWMPNTVARPRPDSHRLPRTVTRCAGAYDAAAAAASPFGEIIVQGGITSGTLNAVVAEDLPGPGTVFLNVNWDFRAPVRPGDEITGAVEILEAREDKPITKLRTTVIRQDGTVVLEGTAVCYTAAVAR
jgi:acyl dehydratase